MACINDDENDDESGLLTLDLSMNSLNKSVHSQQLNELILANGSLRDLNLESCSLSKECLEKMTTTIAKNSKLHFLRLDGNDTNKKVDISKIFKKLKANRISWANSFIISPFTDDDLKVEDAINVTNDNATSSSSNNNNSNNNNTASNKPGRDSLLVKATTAIATMTAKDNNQKSTIFTSSGVTPNNTNNDNNNGLEYNILYISFRPV